MRIDTFFDTGYSPGRLQHLLIDETVQGKGVRAANDMGSSQLLIHINGPSAGYPETLVMGNKESYCLQVGVNKYVKPEFPFYLFNHSCDPNCGINEFMQLVTIRNIRSGEELCWDYSTSMLERARTLNCSCGAPCCRKSITDFDLLPRELQYYYLNKEIVMPFIREYMKNKNRK